MSYPVSPINPLPPPLSNLNHNLHYSSNDCVGFLLESLFQIKGAPGMDILAAGCTILKCVHPVGASFIQTLNISLR